MADISHSYAHGLYKPTFTSQFGTPNPSKSPGKLLHTCGKSMNITISNGKAHYFDWVIFHSYVTTYRRLNPIQNPIKTPRHHHKILIPK